MSQIQTIDQIAKASVLADEGNIPALVEIRDRLRSLYAELESPELAAVAECLEHATRLIEGIVDQEAEDAAASLDQARSGIDYVQRAFAAQQDGRSLSEVGPSPYSHARGIPPPNEAVDMELLSCWLADCAHGLEGLESQVMAIESAGNSPEILAEIRRRLHTFKGECGVLSLHAAQKLCHEAESSIDACISEGRPLPVNGILALVDWMRGYVVDLARNPRAAVPDHAAVLEQLELPADGKQSSTASVLPQVKPVEAIPPSSEVRDRAGPDAVDREGVDDSPVVLTLDEGLLDTVNEFLCESREHLANSEQALLELEKKPEDTELINKVFRAFHTIKGVAGFMNLGPVVSLAHNAECLLDGARTGRVTLDSRKLSVILKTCDLLSQMLGMLDGGTPPTNGRLKAMIEDLEGANRAGAPAASLPSPEATRQDPRPVSTSAPTTSTPVASAPISSAPIAPRATAVAQVAAPAVTVAATASATDIAPELPAASPAGTGCPIPARRWSDIAPELPAASPAGGGAAKRADQTVKVSTSRMDALVDMVGELVIAQQMVVQDPAVRGLNEQRLHRNLTMVGKIIRDLQEVSMSLRMVPIKATFQKMARLVRDVASKAGKQINLHTDGEDVELDRNVVEELSDPLVHMIRNSCDHGIETAEARRAAGKHETGNIWLRAFHSGGCIVVEIADDGKGLDRARIIAKAMEKGIYTPDRPVAEISDSEVFNLIFLPGFSTAEKVTDISGRGVGMDVVRRNIEALRGKIDIRSTTGKGTTFSLQLPLTMAIIDGMVVRVGDQRYVIPTLSIERSFVPLAKDVHTVLGRGKLASVHGGLLPIIRLGHVLGRGAKPEGASNEVLIVVESQETRACLAADEIIGQQQVVIKTLGQGARSIRGVSGGAILGDGRVALILDVGSILSEVTASAA